MTSKHARWWQWPPLWWKRHKMLRTERAVAEERADSVQRTVVEPLRAMRAYEYLTGAVAHEISKQVRSQHHGDDGAARQE